MLDPMLRTSLTILVKSDSGNSLEDCGYRHKGKRSEFIKSTGHIAMKIVCVGLLKNGERKQKTQKTTKWKSSKHSFYETKKRKNKKNIMSPVSVIR